ncbi:MAG TPA: FHA domain-containing protein [Thermoanaerobaculia bacterium]|jgi:DNA-binding winged helix-turn-helix (wHTH) protein
MGLRFGDFSFDSAERVLRRTEATVHLSRKAFDILALLIDRRPRVVSKQELLDEIWQGRAVEEENIKNLIAELRRGLDDDPAAPHFIRTVHGIGYAFCCEIPQTSSAWSLVLAGRTIPIDEETVIGRGSRCQIRLHSSSVSRQHARIRLDSSGPSIEDLQSRNGTFVNGKRIEAPTALQNGDNIEIGVDAMTIVNVEEAPTATLVRH